MRRSKLFAVGLLVSCLGPSFGSADEVKYVNIGGVDYRVTTRTVMKPMSETKIVEREREVYREEYVTDTHEVSRLVTVPVTEYQWETQVAGRWNPFSPPYLVQRLVPRTRLETRTELVKVPVTERRLVPETRIERIPETVRWMAPHEVTEKVALSPLSTRDARSIASRPIGGEKMDDSIRR